VLLPLREYDLVTIATGIAILALTLIAALRLVTRRLAAIGAAAPPALRRNYWLSLVLMLGGFAGALVVFTVTSTPETGRRGALYGLTVFCLVAFPAGLWNAMLWKEIARLSRRAEEDKAQT
jgi:hypothetical protein